MVWYVLMRRVESGGGELVPARGANPLQVLFFYPRDLGVVAGGTRTRGTFRVHSVAAVITAEQVVVVHGNALSGGRRGVGWGGWGERRGKEEG
jgi:hypothetical protein